MSQENADIALRQIEAFNRRDADAAVTFASPNVEWEDSMFWSEPARTYRGRAELREWIKRVLDPWERISVRADEIIQTRDGRVFGRLSCDWARHRQRRGNGAPRMDSALV